MESATSPLGEQGCGMKLVPGSGAAQLGDEHRDPPDEPEDDQTRDHTDHLMVDGPQVADHQAHRQPIDDEYLEGLADLLPGPSTTLPSVGQTSEGDGNQRYECHEAERQPEGDDKPPQHP